MLAVAVVPDPSDDQSHDSRNGAVLHNLFPVLGNILDGMLDFECEPVGLELAAGNSIHENPLVLSGKYYFSTRARATAAGSSRAQAKLRTACASSSWTSKTV